MDINTVSPVNGSGGPADTVVSAGTANQVETVRAASVRTAQETDQKRQAGQGQQEDALSVRNMKEIAEAMNDAMDDLQTSIGFSIREELNHQVVVEIKDRKTDELIKQIPSEELLALKEKMEEFTGLLFDQQA